jgi:predicted acyltransferase
MNVAIFVKLMNSPLMQHKKDLPAGRLLSLDLMRGMIMILLAAESCLLYEYLSKVNFGTIGNNLVSQFFHHPWHGLHFWDLVQPAFMTIAGTAMYLSYQKKLKTGAGWKQYGRHVLVRCCKLFLFGAGLHCIYAGKLVWELWNVLTQLSVTTLIAYLLIDKPVHWQIVGCVVLLVSTEVLYRFVQISGYDQPFVFGKNFGSWMDTVLMGKTNSDGWVAINIIPTAVHTIAGTVIGKVLVSSVRTVTRIWILIAAAAICLLIGYGLDLLNITPIIKRISTSSFVLTSLGWVILILVFLYWIADVKNTGRYIWATVVGMNAIFIYLFFESVGHKWLNGAVSIFSNGIFNFIRVGQQWVNVLSALCTLMVEWYLCYWLYKKRIFFKL